MLDLLRILLRWRRPLLGLSGLAAIASAIYAFAVSPRYYSQASILPPSEDPGFGGISALLQQYQIPVPGGVHTPFLPTLYASIVSSRRMGRIVLDEFDMRAVLGAETEEDAVAALRDRTFLKYTDDGLFLVGFEDEDPKRAADVVNAYVRHLDEIIQQVNTARAGQTRTFVEGQIERCRGDLEGAEEALRDFQRQHQAIQIDAQTQGALGLAAELQGRILAAQVELDLLRGRALPSSPEVRQKTQELAALRGQYASLTASTPRLDRTANAAKGTAELFPPFETVPDLALQYMRLMRDLKVQETVYALLVQQLEQARIEEQKNTPVLSVLDRAEPGERPVYPRKILIVVAAALAGAAWVGIFAVLVEKLRRRQVGPSEAAPLAALGAEWDRMPGWVRRIERLVVR
jgi:uncharacterized protein involved in exopolysaccharide biosynthesis